MGLTSWITLGTIILMFWQIFGKKGSWGHITRWPLILLSAIFVVVYNSLTTHAPWNNPAFIAHVFYGSLFFIGVAFVLPYLGFKIRGERNKSLRPWKRFFAELTVGLLLISLMSINSMGADTPRMYLSISENLLFFLIYVYGIWRQHLKIPNN